jgi:hypothetical protein
LPIKHSDMKNLFPVLAISLVVLLAVSCTSTKETTSNSVSESTVETTKQTEPQILASIERTACYGRCPMYKVTFMDNGEVKYVGKGFVDKIGTYKMLISANEVLEIKNKISEYSYFKLDSLYPTLITDFPSSITEVNLNGKRKKVVNRSSPPPSLKAFEKFLDGLLEGKELEKVSDETDYNPETK